jgi:hypothetical protein
MFSNKKYFKKQLYQHFQTSLPMKAKNSFINYGGSSKKNIKNNAFWLEMQTNM